MNAFLPPFFAVPTPLLWLHWPNILLILQGEGQWQINPKEKNLPQSYVMFKQLEYDNTTSLGCSFYFLLQTRAD